MSGPSLSGPARGCSRFWFGGGFGAVEVIIPCYENLCASVRPFPKEKKLFPVSCISYFGLHAAWVLLRSFRRSNPHQLSNQHRLVHSALATHHPAIIAKSLHHGTDREHIHSYQPSCPLLS